MTCIVQLSVFQAVFFQTKMYVLLKITRKDSRAAEAIVLTTISKPNFLNSDKRRFYALGDCNLDFMKIETTNNFRMHVNNMISLRCECAIDLPTGITQKH